MHTEININSASQGTLTLDGHDISHTVKGGTLKFAAREPTKLTLELHITDGTTFNGHADAIIPDATRKLLDHLGWTPPDETQQLRTKLEQLDAQDLRQTEQGGQMAEEIEQLRDHLRNLVAAIGAPEHVDALSWAHDMRNALRNALDTFTEHHHSTQHTAVRSGWVERETVERWRKLAHPDSTSEPTPDLPRQTDTPSEPCTHCLGCGQLANSEQREPWTMWQNLPPGSDLAVRFGLVHPIPCDQCNGTGKQPNP